MAGFVISDDKIIIDSAPSSARNAVCVNIEDK